MGDSVGHWEGDTLVADTTNFNDKTHFSGSTENLHVIERFTRVDDKTLLYRFTVEDPDTWDRPWTGEYTWPATTNMRATTRLAIPAVRLSSTSQRPHRDRPGKEASYGRIPNGGGYRSVEVLR